MRPFPVLAVLLLGAQILPVRADAAMTAAATQFYTVYGGLPRHSGIPDAPARQRLRAVLSPRLNLLLDQAAAARTRFAAKVKGAAPPLIDGDIFTTDFDGATQWQVGPCTGDEKQGARCPVTLSRQGAGATKAAHWQDILLLARDGQSWKVDDVLYDGALASGNTGRLSGLLGMVLAMAPH